jgi:hypothetical protein
MKTATLIKRFDSGEFNGDARLYKVDPPMPLRDWTADKLGVKDTEYVVVSAVTLDFGGMMRGQSIYNSTETYIFPADETGEITDWGELDGSMKGTLKHSEALREAGYEVAA